MPFATFAAVVLLAAPPILPVLAAGPPAASAQLLATHAAVTTVAPIFLLPDATRTPLRVAAVGTSLSVLKEDGEWVQVEFRDPQYGTRQGWIQTKYLQISRPDLQPMDLSIKRDPAFRRENTDVSRRGETAADPTATNDVQQSVPRDVVGGRQRREGVWFNAGLGLGSLGCEDCGLRWSGLSGGLSVGTAVTDRFLLGVGTTGYSGTVNGGTVSVGTLDVRTRFYFTKTGGGFFTAGVGIGSLSDAGLDPEFGLGVMLGLGWDIRIGKNVSLTPFWSGFAMSNSYRDANVGQLGVGITIH